MPPKSKKSSLKVSKASKNSAKHSSSNRKKSSSSTGKSKKSSSTASSSSLTSSGGANSGSTSVLPPSSGYLVTCDVPTKQFIKHLNGSRTVDKQFILEDLDATHLLIMGKAKDEIMEKVEAWMDTNVFSSVERVGENLET